MRRFFVILLCTATCPISAWAAQPAQSVVPAPDGTPAADGGTRTTTYDPSFFAAFAARTALDMVRQVPGFTLDSGNSDVRGLGGSAGNVVINGARPSSKSESLDTLLSRIPASSVTRIEVGPGDLYGADYASRGRVLNLVLKVANGVDGNVNAALLTDAGGRVRPDFSGSALYKRGKASLNVSAGTGRYINRESGYDRVTSEPSGTLLEFRRKVNMYGEKDPFVSVAAAIEQADNRAIRLNLRYSPNQFDLHQDNHVSPVGGVERDDIYDQDYSGRAFEIGGDVTRPLGGGAVKLVVLATRRKRDNLDNYRFRSLGGATILGGFRQRALSELDESVGRLSWTRQKLMGFSAEVGGEIAYNKLDSDVRYFSVAEGGAETRIDLPIDQAAVSELRGETYLTLGRPVTKALRLDLGLREEWSTLKVRGDTRADRSLAFFKPSATLDWQGKGSWHGQLTARRTVAQLDFFDFISSAEINNDRINGGNANLQPQRAWELRGLLEHPLLGTGQARIEVGFDRISKLQDRILTPIGFDAPGNLGTGRRAFTTLTLDAPLGRLWKGLRVKANGTLQRTRVTDPITSEARGFSGYYPEWEWQVEARRDIGAFAYGLTVADRQKTVVFRTDEINYNINNGPYGFGFVEYRPTQRTTLTLNAENVFDTGGAADRRLYDPNRGPGSLQFRDYRFRNSHVRFTLTAKRTFGGAGKPAPRP